MECVTCYFCDAPVGVREGRLVLHGSMVRKVFQACLGSGVDVSDLIGFIL